MSSEHKFFMLFIAGLVLVILALGLSFKLANAQTNEPYFSTRHEPLCQTTLRIKDPDNVGLGSLFVTSNHRTLRLESVVGFSENLSTSKSQFRHTYSVTDTENLVNASTTPQALYRVITEGCLPLPEFNVQVVWDERGFPIAAPDYFEVKHEPLCQTTLRVDDPDNVGMNALAVSNDSRTLRLESVVPFTMNLSTAKSQQGHTYSVIDSEDLVTASSTPLALYRVITPSCLLTDEFQVLFGSDDNGNPIP